MKKKNNEQLVSIIVPVYNCEKTLARCLNSIIAQTYKNIEIIVIEDGSIDNSRNICEEFMEKDKRIICLFKKNEGVSAARNDGLNIAVGDFICFVDSDDWLDNKFVEVYLSYMEDKIGIVYGGYLTATEYDTCCADKRKMLVINTNSDFDYNCAQTKHYSCWGALYRKSAIENVFFSENYRIGEDALFFVKALIQCSFVKQIGENLYYYYVHDKSVYHQKISEKKVDELYAWKDIVREFERKNITSSLHSSLDKIAYFISSDYYLCFKENNKNVKKAIDLFVSENKILLKRLSIKQKIKINISKNFPFLYIG